MDYITKADLITKFGTSWASDEDFELSQEMKSILDNRLQEESAVYLTADESLDLLRKKYGV